jgi:hypothetical protein
VTTTPIDFVGCEWPVDETCLPEEWDGLDPAVQERSLALASNTLRRLTGYRVGGCPITVRPCRQSCMYVLPFGRPYPYGSYSWFSPRIDSTGAWVNGCGCGPACSCTALCVVRLPGPVGLVEEVKVDGTVVDPSNYKMYGTDLTWVGGGDCGWPTCQNLTLPDTEPDTFAVTYLNSYPVDGLGAYAAGVLAWEYALACTAGVCRLPVGVTAMTRQGVTYEIESGAFPNGFTGIREVDAYIALWNPKGIQRESMVWSPDMPRVHH